MSRFVRKLRKPLTQAQREQVVRWGFEASGIVVFVGLVRGMIG